MTNGPQRNITRTKVDELRTAIGELRRAERPEGLSAEMRESQIEALAGVLGDLAAELNKYSS